MLADLLLEAWAVCPVDAPKLSEPQWRKVVRQSSGSVQKRVDPTWTPEDLNKEAKEMADTSVEPTMHGAPSTALHPLY